MFGTCIGSLFYYNHSERWVDVFAVPNESVFFWIAIALGILGVFGVGTKWIASPFGLLLFLLSPTSQLFEVLLLLFLLSVHAEGWSTDVLAVDGFRKAIYKGDEGDCSHPQPSEGYAILETRSQRLLALFLIFSGVLSLGLTLFPVGQGNAWGWAAPGVSTDGIPSSYVLGGLAICQVIAGYLIFRSMVSIGLMLALFVLIVKAALNPILMNPWLPLVLLGFLNAEPFLSSIGEKLAPKRTYLFYDSTCRFCRRMANIIKSIDILDRISLVDSQAPATYPKETSNHPEVRTMALDFHATDGDKWYVGDRAYAHATPKLPLLWGLYLVLTLPGLRQISAKCYLWVRENRDRLISERKLVTLPRRRNPDQLASHSFRFELSLFLFLSLSTLLVGTLFV